MIETNLTTVDISPSSESTVAVTASTPSTTTVVVGEDGIVSLNTTQVAGVEVLAASPDTVNISVVQEAAVIITTEPLSATTVEVDESGVVTINTIEDAPVLITTGPQQIVKLEPMEEVAVVLVTAAQQGPAGPQGPIGPSGGSQEYIAEMSLGSYLLVGVLPNGNIVPASCTNITYYGTIVGLTTAEHAAGTTLSLAYTGLIDNPSWSFIPGQKVYVGVAGVPTQTIPSTAVFSQIIGTALTSTMMLMNIEPPTLLNGGVNISNYAALYSSYGTVLSTSTTVIDSFSAVLFRSAKYQIQISDGYAFETLEMFVLHDGVNVFMSQYGNVFTGLASQGFFDAVLTTNTISVTFTASEATNKTVKFIRSAIVV